MTQESIELLQKALALPEKERAEMASTLIDSLDPVVDENLEQAWQEEIARRLADVESGKVKPVPWDNVRQDAQAILDGKTTN
jgi:putative addiction module component (TIGR02574 family)